MPYALDQISPRRWSVINSETGKIHSYATTENKAKAQIRLLEEKEMEIEKEIPASTKMSYREYIAKNMKGKKFSSAEEVRAEMRKLASAWKSGKGLTEEVVMEKMPKKMKKEVVMEKMPTKMKKEVIKKKMPKKVKMMMKEEIVKGKIGFGEEPPILQEAMATTSMNAFLF